MFIRFHLVHVRHFLNHKIVVFGPFWLPLWFSAFGSRLTVEPALISTHPGLPHQKTKLVMHQKVS